jgi:hypothetical protein
MRLEVGTFQVDQVAFGPRTELRDGVLTIDREELVGAIRRDARVLAADLEIVRPGDSVRITSVRDMIEPRIKVDGPGQTYPGACGRSVVAVGTGRTHRLAGTAVLEVAAIPRYRNQEAVGHEFVDMSEPGRHSLPIGSLQNVCVVLEIDRAFEVEAQHEAAHAAALLVQDRLAATTLTLTPPTREVFEVDPRAPIDPSLPRIVYVMGLHSPQHSTNSPTAAGTGIYGMTRLTPPWLLHPNELLDGAVSFRASWMHVNNPVVHGLLRRHGKDVNFLGVIAIRTRWSSQYEKDVTAQQTAKLARAIGAQGAIVVGDGYGNDFMELIRAVRACEQTGIQTVLMTGEEPSERGQPLLEPLPEADAIVSLGVGIGLIFPTPEDSYGHPDEGLPPVERVIGEPDIVADPGSGRGRIPAGGPVPSPRIRDIYGFGRRSVLAH